MIRIIGFKDSLNSVEKIDKLVKEFGEGVDRMLTLSTSVTTRQNSRKLGFVLAAPSVLWGIAPMCLKRGGIHNKTNIWI